MNNDPSPQQNVRIVSLPGLACLVFAVQAMLLHAGTEGFGLGLEGLPLGADHPVGTEPGQPAMPWQPPPEHFNLSPAGFATLPSLPIRLRDDFVSLAVVPLDWDGTDWRRLGLGVLAVGAVSLFDEKINRWADRTRSDRSDRAIRSFRPLGEEVGLGLLGVAWLAGRATNRAGLSAAAEDGLEATIIAAGVVTPTLKTVFGRTRPGDTAQGHSFGGAGGSFPSGEATQAFAIASVIAAHSESSWTKAAAWGCAGLLGLGRIGLDGHWASDVVAGALIGTAVGRWVVRRNRPDLGSRSQLTWVPTVNGNGYGLAVHLSF